MPDTQKRVGPRGLVPGGETVFTVPLLTKVTLKMFTFANSSLNSVPVWVSIGDDAWDTRLVPGVRLPGRTELDIPSWHILDAGHILVARADEIAAVALTISYVEHT